MKMEVESKGYINVTPTSKRCYTAGELAKLAGVSSRTIRFYDQKGLLKPVAYSEGNYRLYDESSLLQLQKIMMLKFADFSLEEIEYIMEEEKQTSLQDILWKQKLLLMQKRERLDGVIAALNDVIVQYNEETEETGWEKIAELMQRTNREEAVGKRFDFYEKYSLRQKEWHPWIMEQMKLEEGMRVLDMGCGAGLVWMRNWKHMPAHVQITAIDRRDTGIEVLERFYQENKSFLQEGVRFRFIKGDLEQMGEFSGTYDRIVANHLWNYIQNPLNLMEKVKWALTPEGYMVSTISAVGCWEAVDAILGGKNASAAKMEVEYSFQEVIEKQRMKKKMLEEQLRGVFSRVQENAFENVLVMKDVKVCQEYLQSLNLETSQNIQLRGGALERKIGQYLKQEGEMRISSVTPLYCCYRE